MSDEVHCDAKSVRSASTSPAEKPTANPGVVDAVGIQSALPAAGLHVPLCTAVRGLPVDGATVARKDGNEAAMARYSAGDDAAFAELYDGLAPLVRAYLRRRTRDHAWVEDLLQDTFLRLHQHRARYRRDAPVLPWVLTIAARLLANRVRGTRRANAVLVNGEAGREVVADTASPEQLAMVMELAGQIEQEISQLPDVDREAFDLVKRQDLSLKDAAPRLSMTTMALKMRLFRVYNRLRGLNKGGSAAGTGERKLR
jgi:RNA polymerase sigma-70 factor, ECF subfamily